MNCSVHIAEGILYVSPGLFKKTLEKFKTIDLVVNNAGIMNDHLVQKTIDINLVSTLNCFLFLPFYGA